jgi:hypothetical protein
VKVFISWSGDVSRLVAEVLRKWLQDVLQAVEPFMSEEDTGKGTVWVAELTRELRETEFGIICLTPDNLSSPWIHYEAGALSNAFEGSRVSPFLFGVRRGDVGWPLAQFQSTLFERNDVLKLVHKINEACSDRAIEERAVERAFNRWWDELSDQLQMIARMPAAVQRSGDARSHDELLREILDLIREQSRLLSDPAELLPIGYVEALVRHATAFAASDPRNDLESAFGRLRRSIEALPQASGESGAREVSACADELQGVFESMITPHAPRRSLRARVIDDQRRWLANDQAGQPPQGEG